MVVLRVSAATLFLLALPLLLVTTALRLVMNNLAFYESAFVRHGISRATGLELPQLLSAARQIIDYYDSDQELITVRVIKNGQEVVLFNEREVLHLKDVKELFRLAFAIQEGASLYVLSYALMRYAMGRRGFWPHLAKLLLGGSGLILGIGLGLGLLVLWDFGRVFWQFHLLSFRNDLWLLDPQRDYLIRLFPQAFFFEATLLTAGLALGAALLMGGVCGAFLWRRSLKAMTFHDGA